MRWLLVVALLVLTGCSSNATSEDTTTVRVAAAADLKFAFDEITEQFEQQNPEITVLTTYGSSGTFFQQIGNGAPFDLYLSADLTYPEKLVADGHGSSEDLFEYAVGRIVVWAPKDSPVQPTGLESLADPAARKVSIANPEHAPYGVAAVAAMKDSGVYDQVKDKMVLGENVAQAAEFVQSGNAQIGVIALSLALSPPMRESGSYYEVPLDAYPRIDQGGLVLTDSAAARSVRDYLISEPGTDVLKRYGFFLPGQ